MKLQDITGYNQYCTLKGLWTYKNAAKLMGIGMLLQYYKKDTASALW
jgi:hypothetical protein